MRSLKIFLFFTFFASCKTTQNHAATQGAAVGPKDTCYTTPKQEDGVVVCLHHVPNHISVAMLQQDDYENNSQTGAALMWCETSTKNSVNSDSVTLNFDDAYIRTLTFTSKDQFKSGKAELTADAGSPKRELEFTELPSREVQAAQWVWSNDSCKENVQ